MHTRTANLNGPGEIVKASDLMDEHVRGTGGDRLGRLHDLMVDLNTGSIGYVIVGDNNAFSGKLFAVPWNAFTVRSGRRGEPGLALNISDRDLSNAPSFDRDRWPNLSSRRWTEVVHNYYGVEPTWTYYGYVDSESEAQRFQGSQGRQNLESQQQGSSLFDPQSTRTINGTIESMNRNARLESTGSVVRLEVAISGEGPAAQGTSTPGASTQPGATGRQAGVTTPMGSSGLRAQAGSQVISVFLGPASFLQEQQISLKPGDSITVEGSQVMLRNSPALLATRLTKEGKSIELRDRQGQPLWSRSGQGQQNPMGQESSNLQGSETGTGSNQPGSSGSTGRDASGTSGTGGAATGGTSGSTGTGVGQTPGSTSGGAVGSSAGGTSGAIGNPGTPNPPSGPQATPGQTR
jgi:sporulation protein YlmC with PRC-barrel domain